MSTLVILPGLAVERVLVRSVDVERKEITWELGNGQEDPLDYTFQVLRSESPEGPFEAISEPFSDQFIFVDRRIPTGDRFVELWYRIRVTRRRDGKSYDTEAVAQQPEPDRIAVAIRRLELTYFTQVVGRAVWLFKKRTFGPRCRDCFDATMGKRTVDRCLSCFNTGVVRGYHNPIEVYVQIDPPSKSQQNQGQQISQLVQTSARTSFYPNINPSDILVEAENKRWRVQQQSESQQRRATIKQELVLRQIDDRDIEFALPIKLDRALRDIQPSPRKFYEMNTDVDSAIENQTSDAFLGFLKQEDDLV